MKVMSDQQINLTQLLDTFQLFDTDKNGSISFKELRSACEKLHMPIDKKRLKEHFQYRNDISFDEFCRIIQDFIPLQSEDAYFQETFRAFDKNSDGFITAKEIKKTMKQLGERLSDKQAKEMLREADSNGDGKLSKDEFRILFNHLTQFTTPSSISSSSSMTINEHNSHSINHFS